MLKTFLLLFLAVLVLLPQPVEAQSLVAAVLPSSRAVTVGTPATAFATIINTGSTTATNCRLVPPTSIPATFSFQTTNPATNQVTGTPNTGVSVAPNAHQSFVFAFTPTAAFSATDVHINFTCSNTASAPVVPGLNTLLLSASTTLSADIVALAATPTTDGVVRLPAINGAGAFAVATVNVGAGDSITVRADTGSVSIPVSLSICQTNPSTGLCLSAPSSSVTTSISAMSTPTFGIFVQATAAVSFDPAQRRIFVRFQDGSGLTRGSTSVAVSTPADTGTGTATYAGTVMVSVTNCQDPANNDSFTDSFTFTLPVTPGLGITTTTPFTVTTSVEDVTVTVAGSITPAGVINGTFNVSGPDVAGTGTVTGTASANTISLTLNGQLTAGETCQFSETFSGTR
jgi:hypothetical protein